MHKQLTKGALHDARGHLAQTGYATALLRVYDRKAVRAHALFVKEWDYYLIACERYALALTIADNGYMGLDSVSLLDFERVWHHTQSPMCVMPLGKRGLSPTSEAGDVSVGGRSHRITFENDGAVRHLFGHMDNFRDKKPIDFDIRLTDAPPESMVIVTPFPGKPKAFYYNQKINNLRARGWVKFDGREYVFDPADSFAVLDWGRGVWTYNNTWYWGSASGLVDGVPFGFNIGYGFGDTSAASENMLFYDGKAHKLSRVQFHIPKTDSGKEDYLAPWRFTSDDGRFEMAFSPILDRASCTNALLICSDQHQVFGRFTGAATLDDGSVIQIRDFLGFAEKVKNRW